MEEKSVPKRRYTEEFKTEAARLAQTVGQHEAARRLGVPVATLGNWVRKHQKGQQGQQPSPAQAGNATALKRPVSELEAENSRLRKELASAKLDIEILRKATAYCVSRTQARACSAVLKMGEGLPKSVCRDRLQTARCCCVQKAWW
jgi:transposase